jgi:hypothetical protein
LYLGSIKFSRPEITIEPRQRHSVDGWIGASAATEKKPEQQIKGSHVSLDFWLPFYQEKGSGKIDKEN